jgi:hypothetical protein
MTIEEIRREVEGIRASRDDCESAHADEDSLHQAVLAFIASGECPDPAAFATAALETTTIRFDRWYA